MTEEVEKQLVRDAIVSTAGGYASRARSQGRAAKKNRVPTKISLAEFHRALKSRLDGLAGHFAKDDDGRDVGFDESDADFSETVEAVNVATPSVEELRDEWLPEVLGDWPGFVITGDYVGFDVEVPPPRKAHSR